MTPSALTRLPLLVVFVVVVLGTAANTYRLQERSGRSRWRRIARPPVRAGRGAYREGDVAAAPLASAPRLVRVAAFLGLLQGRVVALGLLVMVLSIVDGSPGTVQRAATSVMVGYLTHGDVVGAVALMVTAAMLVRTGSVLLLREWTTAFAAARNAGAAAAVTHALVATRTGRALFGGGPWEAAWGDTLAPAFAFAAASLAVAVVVLAAAFRHRALLEAPPAHELFDAPRPPSA